MSRQCSTDYSIVLAVVSFSQYVAVQQAGFESTTWIVYEGMGKETEKAIGIC